MPSSSSLTALCDAAIFTGEAMVEGHALLIQDGKIVDIVAQGKIPGDAQKTSHGGHILAPGFIDAQVNGGGNILFNNTPTAEACLAIAKAHRRYGTTRILPTCITDTPEITRQAVVAAREARKKDKSILGIHIEGPHLGMERRGVHKADYLRPLNPADMQLYRPQNGEVMLITVAPENTSPENIKALRQQGVIISLGHTQAKPEEIHAVLTAGATGFTHLFNGMGGISARDASPAQVALDDRDSWCGLIADGHHVSAEMIRLALRAKPKGKIFLVSDAMAPAATDTPQPFQLYGEAIRVESGRCINHEGKLAGSSITLADAVRHCVQNVGVELEEALRMTSTYPAEFLGLGRQLGRLLPGYEADVIALNQELKASPV
ncbi:MAG: N-acetylglucosamine-6-phosphate deacetylase [Alphaproteobacteria bacterium]|nr:N-acetylglucosamine-6-phosphate deacetylase [Alphaproteobacteria bacterium]